MNTKVPNLQRVANFEIHEGIDDPRFITPRFITRCGFEEAALGEFVINDVQPVTCLKCLTIRARLDKASNVKYPEHVKLKTVADESQAIGDFLEWLEERGVHLGAFGPGSRNHGLFQPIDTAKEAWLAGYFEVDLKKLETEKVAMLDAFTHAADKS